MKDGHFSDHACHGTEGEPLPGTALGGKEYLQRDGRGERLGVGPNSGRRNFTVYVALVMG